MHARDPADLYKDRIEVSLDGRQIFYLFFGGAVIVGLVFVVGVMVGRRIEARGHVGPARAAAAADPLAALDRLEGTGGLSFQGTLTGSQAPTEVERAIGELEKARGVKAEPAPAPAPKPEKKLEPKLERADRPEPKPDKAEPKPDRPDRPKIADRADRAEPKEPKEPRKKKKSDGDPAGDGSARFTLQLSSFQDRQEADAFLSSLRAAGFQAHVTETDVGGKGTFYRVRFGSFRSVEAANDAKAELERVTKKNASVMRL